MFKETMATGEGEFQEKASEDMGPLDMQILDVNDKITKAEDFIKALEEMQSKSPTDQRQKDIINAKIDLAESQTEKQHLLDEKFKKWPTQSANDSVIDPVMEGIYRQIRFRQNGLPKRESCIIKKTRLVGGFFDWITVNYLTASLSALAAENFGTFVAGTLTVSPVFGLRASRALRSFTVNLPRPAIATSSPLVSVFTIVPNTVSTTSSA
jgi:hypothetical protein